jgi:hypothetical protein
MTGYKYLPTEKHLAKLHYRFALLMKMMDQPGTEEEVVGHINTALRLQPGDPVLHRERDNIELWLRLEED